MENSRNPGKPAQTKADKFWGIFLPTKNGKLKSTLIVNSFSLSMLFLAVYAFAYLMLLDPLEAFLVPRASHWLTLLAESIIPALVGTTLCCPLFFLFKDKKLVPAAYIWLALFVLFALIYLLATLDPQDRGTFLFITGQVALAPLLTGGGLSAYLYAKRKKEYTPIQELPRWKRK